MGSSAALKEAQQVDERLAEGNEDEKSPEESVPYLGVPFTVKEAFALEELHLNSSPLLRWNDRPTVSTCKEDSILCVPALA
ncbi:fatty-acid amide hydrolase 2-like [Mobula birostris]|uniref:fatty-acid amide hydrolase 2-like n=1 Tax=Mobula birostris TaxID=1983395 RepID=UPI003B282692